MVIDSLNLFIRNYIRSPVLSTNGQPLGGVAGYLRSLQKFAREIKPDEIIVVWDGPGGSRKRKGMISGYKEGRSPIRLNRSSTILTENQELENKIWQQVRLTEYLNNFPIVQILEPEIEADDLISFVCQHNKYKDWHKIIISCDKDFIQLCDDKTVLYRPIQEDILTWKKVVEEYGIHPNNFAMARSMAGDKSDNIAGIRGVGLKSVEKYLPFFKEEKSYFYDDIEKKCLEKIEEGAKTKFYQSVLDNLDLIRNNYGAMQLYFPSISAQVARKTRETINNFKFELNITDTEKMLLQDGIAHSSFEELYACFRKIVVNNK